MSTANVAQHKNEVHLAGVLARSPIVRLTSTGKKVANLTLATTYEKHTEFHRVTAWDNHAEKVEGLPKGEFIKVVGRLQTRSWEDANKVKHYTTEVVAWNIGIPAKDLVTTSTTGAEVTDVPF